MRRFSRVFRMPGTLADKTNAHGARKDLHDEAVTPGRVGCEAYEFICGGS